MKLHQTCHFSRGAIFVAFSAEVKHLRLTRQTWFQPVPAAKLT
jgi:hypothetical protein